MESSPALTGSQAMTGAFDADWLDKTGLAGTAGLIGATPGAVNVVPQDARISTRGLLDFFENRALLPV